MENNNTKFEERYNIFACYDYKGGELYSSTNLSKEGALIELYENWLNDVDYSCDELLAMSDEEIERLVGEWEDRRYDAYGDTLPEVYVTTPSGELKAVSFSGADIKEFINL